MATRRHTISKIIILLLCAAAALYCAAPALAAGDPLTVGVPADRCPLFYRDGDTGEPVGIGVDLMRSAAEAAGYDVTFRFIEEKTLKDALDSGVYDVLMPFGSAIKSASGGASVVSENLIQTPFTLVTEGKRELPPINDLHVGMLSSLSGGAETVHQLYPGIEITMYETMSDCVKALRRGEVDALLHNSYVWSYVLQKPSYSDLAVQPSAMFSMDFRAGAADTPEGRAVMERLNGGIEKLTDTRRQAIILDHTSRRLYKYDFSDYVYRYGLSALLVAMLFAALLVIAWQKVRAVRKEQEEKLRRLIDHDQLTGALSLEGFKKRVRELIYDHPDVHYLLSYVNIRNFKYINASLGREAGDELLRFWVKRTQETLSDVEAICRVTGDRFAVLRRSRGEEGLRMEDEEVIDTVRNYFIDRGMENRLQICGGVYVLTPEDYRNIDVDRMLDFARVAEKRVHATRNDGYQFYNPDQWERGKKTADVVSRLPVALKNGEIQVWYQPQVDYAAGKTIGAEALCRWNHPVHGWISPAEFIPLLENAGLIFDLDKYVWERVCQDLKTWDGQGRHWNVSVNLSRSDIREDRNIPKLFDEMIRRYGLTHDRLRIEITESAYAESPELLIQTTVRLRELGFTVEMDDFGSGYSSLHMLREVPVDRIKLDMNFLSGRGDPKRGRIIIGHIIGMISSLGMEMIAEGVETEEQADFLLSQGCAEMQGYRFYKPMPVSMLDTVITETAN